ncbi:SpoIIE family protein phosphatase [Planctomicrobium sp. SH661]|uniref:SpoIIE family protein phosphatase n=1 Tax=Planctomicrobium sp. SH661 TaxID=3448124 RepID=UPI003F5AE4F0
MATLIVLAPPSPGTRVVLQKGRQTVLGRDPTCDLVLNKRSISRFHAQVVMAQGTYYLEDMKSTNGTFVNGSRVQNRVSLKDGDRIAMHDIPLAFFVSDSVNLNEEQTQRLRTEAEVQLEPEVDLDMNRATTGVSTLRGRLKILIEITRDLGSTLEIKEILPRVLDLLFRMFPPAVIGEIHLLDEEQKLAPVAMKHGREADSTDLTGAPFNLELIQKVFESGQGLVHTEGANDPALALDGFHQSIICAPVLGAESKPCGVILLETNDSSYLFGEGDLEILSAVAVLAGQAIGYSQAHDIVVQHNMTIRQMETARQIQLGMLPRNRPAVRGYAFGHHYAPAERVGGDYFFYEMLRDGRVILGIADASGKGLPAAMNIARFAGEVRLQIATSPSLKSALASLNQFVIDGAEECMFITACLCVLDPQQHLVAIANAGHPPPLLKRAHDNTVEELTSQRRNFPLGIASVFEAHPWTVKLEPGDRLLLYTDGVTEAMNTRNEMFGTARLRESLGGSFSSIDDLVQEIVKDVGVFRDGRTANDDMTIVGVERLQYQP